MELESVAITGIDIHTYLVKDADRATAFWRDTTGLKQTWSMPGRGAEFELADGATFGIWKMDDDTWQPGSGIMFAVPEIRTAAAYYRNRGVAVADHIEENPSCFMAFATDSEGNAFILHQRKSQPT